MQPHNTKSESKEVPPHTERTTKAETIRETKAEAEDTTANQAQTCCGSSSVMLTLVSTLPDPSLLSPVKFIKWPPVKPLAIGGIRSFG